MHLNKFFASPALIFLLVFILSVKNTYADHLKGGWIKYTYQGNSGENINYRVSFYQYSDCSEPEKVDAQIFLGIYDASTLKQLTVKTVSKTSLTTERKSDFGPCFQNPPTVCYLVAEYTTNISIPANAEGYILSVQRCCRIIGIENVPSSNTYGLTYTITIPGGSNNDNNSPVFDFNDVNAICYGSFFSFDFSAKDPDGDSLVYSLCNGLTGGTQFKPIVTDPPAPPYATIPYTAGYSGSRPLGLAASIDSKTGIFSGTAPQQTGTYVAAVCVDEFRNGVYIGHTRKELHLDVANCKLGGAELDPSYVSCNGYNFTFKNKAGENPDYYYAWDFGVQGITTDTSSNPKPSYNYPDTGVYTVHLKARNDAGCEDSASTQVKIFPGFITDFSIDAKCISYPYDFKDLTTTKYGFVNTWRWFFGESGEPDDTLQNPSYTYLNTGLKTVTLISTNSKGCVDTAVKTLNVTIGPDLSLKFPDTLICIIDTLQLQASSQTQGAVFNWSPSYNIIGSNKNNPLVYPKQTTTYNVNLSYKGCTTLDSVTVNVIDHVSLGLPPDTIICKTDPIQLTPSTDALYFLWSPSQTLSSDDIQYPIALPVSNTTYSLRASVGNCFATDAIRINVAPYPVSDAGIGKSICYGTTTQLSANINGAHFTWSPANSLVNANTLTPIAGPQETTTYTLQVTDTLGCPKPVYDSVTVAVIPKVKAFAGNDTTVVRIQPLQLTATGGTNYHWYPSSGLNNPDIYNPVVTFSDGGDTLLYSVKVSTPEGCFSTDSVRIFVFETQPEVFIPTAFTPNGDGRNDEFRPTVAGMKQFSYLRIYNRWGQLLFNSGRPDIGWDGTFKGTKQASGTYVYTISAVDYTNKPYLKKGTFVLIR